MGIVSFLFKATRVVADAKAATSGDPKKMARRGKNKAIGRGLARAGLLRRLFG